jgi:flagellar motility protein MotE (MotC chaperone)
VRQVRLLPIVIVAAFALLLFKGIGLWTAGGYVLLGTTSVEAAGGGDHGAPAATTGEDGEVTLEMPHEPTLTDDGPTLEDGAPTLGAEAEGDHGAPAADHGAEADDQGADTAAEGAADHPTDPAEGDHATEPAAGEHGATAVAETACPDGSLSAEEIGESISHATTTGAVPGEDCPPADPRAEQTPMQVNGGGQIEPLVAEGGGSFTEQQILERLAARRAELDARETELAMRLDLVAAAEAKLEERTQALLALEARVNALVEEQKAVEEGDFAGLIAMYEVMKPSEAAIIFDELDMNVLLRVARGINPRKMSPILAKMEPERAQDLTVALAQDATQPAEPTMPNVGDLSSLPQIVGQ